MRALILLFLIFIVSSCKNNSVQPASQVEYGSGVDYEVYQAVLHERFDSSDALLVLRDTSVTSICGQIPDSILASYFKEHLPGLLDETIRGFVSVNETPTSLMYVRSIPRLVLDRDYDGTDGGSKVSLSMSRVGYDSSRTQAVVEIGEVWAPLAGGGTMFLLARENGKWKIKATCMTWIS